MEVLLNNDNCIEHKSQVVSVASCNHGSKTRYELNNHSKYPISKIDMDCVFNTNEDEKCDYAFVIETNNKILINFIELKDSKLTKAASQISTTIDRCNLKVNEQIINARIILTSTHRPDIDSSQVRNLKEKIKRFGGTVDYKTRIIKENI